jgi:predicted phage tail protein
MPHDTTMPIPEASTSDHAASIVVGTSTGLLAMGAWIGTMLDRIAGAILITLVSTLMTAAVSYIAKGIPQMVIRLKFENARLRNRLAAAESANAKKDGA